MRKWFLLALLGLVLLMTMTYREGVSSTLTPTATCPTGSRREGSKCVSQTGGVATSDNMCMPNTVLKNGKCYPATDPTCPSGYILGWQSGKCEKLPEGSQLMGRTVRVTGPDGKEYTTQTLPGGTQTSQPSAPLDTFDDNAMLVCNRYWDSAISSWAGGRAASPATATAQCKKYAPSWITMSMAAGTLTTGSGKPTDATKRQAIIETKQATEYAAETASAKAYASSTGYAALAAQASTPGGGPPPSSMNATARPMDVAASRSSVGTVFGEGGPFSGRPGAAANAASTLTGSTPPTRTRSDPYGFPGTKGGTSTSGGSSLPVDGPNWGGMGRPTTASVSRGSQPGPVLYGPAGTKLDKNSGNRYTLPSFGSSGSEPWNKYAATSRAPGDQDPFGAAYNQAASYSLGNTLQKTNPVPYLTDFSAFLK